MVTFTRGTGDLGVEPKIGVFIYPPKMDGENNGSKPDYPPKN